MTQINSPQTGAEELPEGENLLDTVRSLRDEVHSLQSAVNALEAAQSGLRTASGVADYLGVSLRTVETLISLGELRPIWIRGARRFTPEGVEAFLHSAARERPSRRRIRRVPRGDRRAGDRPAQPSSHHSHDQA